MISHLLKLSVTFTFGLAVALAGTALAWYQATTDEINDTAMSAAQVIRINEQLLDEASSAARLARPLLLQPCTLQTRTELSRLAIGIEHIRIINLYKQDNLVCSSWDGALTVKEDIPGRTGHALTLLNDSHVSPGVPVMVVRTVFPEGVVTASMTTHWTAASLRLHTAFRPLILKTGDMTLDGYNHLALDSGKNEKTFDVIKSERYPFSVAYDRSRVFSLAHLLHEGAATIFLSVLLGTCAAAGLWLFAFRPRTPYEQLAVAIKRGEILPWYQPVINSQTGDIIGVEVLARLVKADGRVVTPDRFIPVAESSDLIIPLTRGLMAKAAAELSALRKTAGDCWHININLTQAHVLEPGFITECLEFVDAFAPESIVLTLELTEREEFDSSLEMLTRLQLLHDNGINTALDDFGTGYANLEYLSEIQVDIIKIDRTFVRRIGHGEPGERLLTSLIEMACALELQIVAEGIETREQAEWLSLRGVNWQQGYLYSPPVPLQELGYWLVNRKQSQHIQHSECQGGQ